MKKWQIIAIVFSFIFTGLFITSIVSSVNHYDLRREALTHMYDREWLENNGECLKIYKGECIEWEFGNKIRSTRIKFEGGLE